ncbi:MAG: peptidoglycan DD-metalloendopeptidase family protein [Paracoccus sp. (in: a-proteobacteria)]|uniref:peptidoglycan DD-metalloendopeptidase family protein n=1 Tax=Paracoccus sp. TaxID=267 RepID=UPI0026DF6201|nr:peptidoglycan DD-metalloendopeptidase family protein [Paracoccus sp. (in: a-proteobacteria)]MDO5622826.1 peptidoglycan DD-metalloendopeptidase family protein [Paracoccus sp. (in: a-proteobacteria)]
MTPPPVDPRFRQMGRGARRRRVRAQGLRWGAGVIALGVVVALGWRYVLPDIGWLRGGDLDQTLVQVESQFDIAPVVRADTFTDIPGDPLIIPPPTEQEARRDVSQLPVPTGLAGDPRLIGRRGMLTRLDSRLVPADRQLVASLPSTREEFALFQAERGRSGLFAAHAASLDLPEALADQRMTSSVSFLRDAGLRNPLWRDMILEAALDISTEDLLVSNGIEHAQAARLAARLNEASGHDGNLRAGSVLALRYRQIGAAKDIVQMTLYGPDGWMASVALSAAGQMVPAADAWVDQPLLAQLQGREGAGGQRLLDLIYSTALRNDLSAEIAGDVIAMMARVHDLDRMADDEDRLTLIFAETAPGAPPAILFAGISGPDGDRLCYVVPAPEGAECFTPSQTASVPPAMVPPVAGVLSLRFVPPAPDGADDPARGRIVWTAPAGVPVLAVADGQLRPGTDGTSAEITHPNGMVSRYAGLGALSDSAAQGGTIRAGTAIGTVGAQGRLVFQLISDGAAIDPMPLLSGVGEVRGSDAAELLVARIITVESAGNPRARNPLSTATGLGQFIESTWLRMMRSYRPDLTASLDRAALLNLRFDPDLSRQMVRHLAQENESFLRARGHQITPGRLYLAHFLGPAGADQALRASPQASVLQVMGPAVVNANPFLRNYSIADLHNWADRKMQTRVASTGQLAVPETVIPTAIREYIAAVDHLRL